MRTTLAAVYLRCSTKSQETELQESEITDFCSRRGWKYKIYRDTGKSGAKESKPALDSRLSDVRKRRVDVLVVWALDRLARSLKQLLRESSTVHFNSGLSAVEHPARSIGYPHFRL